MARTWNGCIRLGGIRCFISYAGFKYAYEQGVLTIRQASDVNLAKRIYINGKHISLAELSTRFGVDVDVISNWRNQLWKSFSKKEKARCIAYHNYKFLGETDDPMLSITVAKERPKTTGIMIVDCKYKTVTLNTLRHTSPFLTQLLKESNMNQQQRLARVKQKQREYCLNYGMPESLIERNVAFAVTKFYAEEDKHQEQLKKKRNNLLHDMNMLDLQINAEKNGYDRNNELTKKYHKLFSEATQRRNAYAKAHGIAVEVLANKQLELEELNKQLEN